MTRLQQVQMRQSELRSKLKVALDTPTEQRSDTFTADVDSITAQMAVLETELRAAMLVEEEPETTKVEGTPEDREIRSMVEQANVGAIFEAALERRSIDGVEAELQKHFGLQMNQVPLALLETRAVTPAPANVGQTQQPIIPIVFPQSAAAFLGVDMPTVGVGEAVFPVLTAGASAQTPAENTALNPTDDTGAFSADVLSPTRLQASFLYSREDRARFAGMDSALRENLSLALSDGLDKALLAGTNGLLTGTNLANHNAAAITTYDNYVSQFGYDRVDGKYAATVGELRTVVGAATYAHMGKVYRNSTVDTPVLDRLMGITGGVRVSAHVPAVAGNKQNAAIQAGTAA